MDCQHWRDKFTDFIENALPEDEWRALEAHLQSCEACAAEIKAFRRSVSALRSLEVVEPPRGLVRRISEAVAQAVEQPEPEIIRVRPRRFSWQVVGSLAAAATLLIAFTLIAIRSPLMFEQPGRTVLHPRAVATAPGPAPEVAAEEALAPAFEEEPPAAPALDEEPTMVAEAPKRTVRGPGPGARAEARDVPTPEAAPAEAVEEAPLGAAVGSAGPEAESAKLVPTGAGRGAWMAGQPRQPFAATGADSRKAPGAAVPGGIDLQIVPPVHPQVGTRATVTITVRPNVDFQDVVLTVTPRGALMVVGSTTVYSGPLAANQRRQFKVGVISSSAGTQHLTVRLRTDVPGVESSLDAELPGFTEPAPSVDAGGKIRLALRSVPLREALRKVATAGRLDVEIADSVGNERVTADFSDGASPVSALKAVAGLGGCRVEKTDAGYLVR